MAEQTLISWCDKTWSPWYGCTQVSMGEKGACVGCYARQISEIRQHRVVFGGPGRGEGTRDPKAESGWKEPLKWEREQADLISRYLELTTAGAALQQPDPCFIFPSMCDPFDNHPDVRHLLRRFFDLIRATPHLTWLLLTKRPGNIEKLYGEAHLDLPDGGSGHEWPKNAFAGCTVVTQDEARELIKLARAASQLGIPQTFVSAEPMMEEMDFFNIDLGGMRFFDAFAGVETGPGGASNFWKPLNMVIVGGETDQGSHRARMMEPDWARSMRDQCRDAGALFHLKQMTRKAPVPADLQIQDRFRGAALQ